MGAGRRALRALILAYRRFVSGRGPMRAVGCSFVACESCSAYGLRMAETAPNLLVACAQIQARLRRCRSLSIYRLHERGRELLAWGSDYDQPELLAARLLAARELPLTRWAVLDAARQITAYRGQWAQVSALLAARDACFASPPSEPGSILVRRSDQLLARSRQRSWVQLCVLGALSGGLALLTPPGLSLALALLASAYALRMTLRSVRRRRRFARLIAAAHFTTAARAELS